MPEMNKRALADRLLYEYGLLDRVSRIGEPHIIGSYRMDMIVANDLDIDVLNTDMSIGKLHELTGFILESFHPVWYEAKQEVTSEGKTVWFHGFETKVLGDLWNVDIWFFDQDTIETAEAYCDEITRRTACEPALRDIIVSIKKDLLTRGIYGRDGCTSVDVYKAVLEHNVRSSEEYLVGMNGVD